MKGQGPRYRMNEAPTGERGPYRLLAERSDPAAINLMIGRELAVPTSDVKGFDESD